MRSFLIEVRRVFLDHPLQMFIVMDQNMIQALPAQTAHKPFADPIRLRRSIRRYQLFDS